MTEAIVIIALLAYIGWKEYQTGKERRDLLRFIKARDLDEVSRAEMVDKAKPEEEEDKNEYIPLEQKTDEEFMKLLQEESH